MANSSEDPGFINTKVTGGSKDMGQILRIVIVPTHCKINTYSVLYIYRNKVLKTI